MTKDGVFGWIFAKAITFIGISLFLIKLTLKYEQGQIGLFHPSFLISSDILFLLIFILLFLISEIKLQEILNKN